MNVSNVSFLVFFAIVFIIFVALAILGFVSTGKATQETDRKKSGQAAGAPRRRG